MEVENTSIKLWQYDNIGLIGRTDILNEMCERILDPTKCFILRGSTGIGKSALIEWAYENHHKIGAATNPPVQMEDCAFINARQSLSNIYKKIIEGWNLEMPREKNNDMLAGIIQGVEGKTLYVDDLQEASKQKLYNLRIIGQYNKINGVIVTGGKKLSDELIQLMIGRKPIDVPKLKKEDALRLAGNIALHYKQKIDLYEIINKARGKPLNIINLITTGEIPKGTDDLYLDSEILDISPVIIVVLVALIIARMMGRAMQATDLAIIGSAAMLARLFLMMFMRGNK